MSMRVGLFLLVVGSLLPATTAGSDPTWTWSCTCPNGVAAGPGTYVSTRRRLLGGICSGDFTYGPEMCGADQISACPTTRRLLAEGDEEEGAGPAHRRLGDTFVDCTSCDSGYELSAPAGLGSQTCEVPPNTNTASGKLTLDNECAQLPDDAVKAAIALVFSKEAKHVFTNCQTRTSSSGRRLLANYALITYGFPVSASTTAADLVITTAELIAALETAGFDTSLASTATITAQMEIEPSLSSNLGGSLASAIIICAAPLFPLVASNIELQCNYVVTNDVKTDLSALGEVRSLPFLAVSPVTAATGQYEGLLFPFTITTPSHDFEIWGEWSDGGDLTQGHLKYIVYEEVGEFSTVSCTGALGLLNTVTAGEQATCTVVPRTSKDGPAVTTVVEQFVIGFVSMPVANTTVAVPITGTSPGDSFTFDYQAPDAGVTSKVLAQMLKANSDVVDVITLGQVYDVSVTDGLFQPAGALTSSATTVQFTPQNDICEQCKVDITLPTGFDYRPSLGQPVVSTGGTWTVTTTTTNDVQVVSLTRTGRPIGDETSVANVAIFVTFPKASIMSPSRTGNGETSAVIVATYQASGLPLDFANSGTVYGPTLTVLITPLSATTSSVTETGECDLTISFVVPLGQGITQGDVMSYSVEGFEEVTEETRRRRMASSTSTLTLVASQNYQTGDTVSNTWRVQMLTTSSDFHGKMSVSVGNNAGAYLGSALATIAPPQLPFTSALVSDPYLWKDGEWVPTFPPTDKLVELVTTKNFQVLGAFAQAEKSDCQCIWMHPDPTLPPTPGTRMVAAFIKAGSVEFDIALWGMQYKQDGRWMKVDSESWPQLKVPGMDTGPDNIERDDSDGIVITSSNSSFSWAAVEDTDLVPKEKQFPWGTHHHSHVFRATVGSETVEVILGSSDGIEVLDVYLKEVSGRSNTGLLLGK